MTDGDRIDDFLRDFARLLPGDSLRARRALWEIEDHLRERANELCRSGMDRATAATGAVERFGSASDVLRQFELEAPLESEVCAMLRYALTGIAVGTTAFAALIFGFAWFDDALPLETFAKILLALAIVAYNSVLLFSLWRWQPSRLWMPWFVFAGGLLLIAVGAAGFVWTAHLGQITGDWESYGFVVGAMLVLQGSLAAVHSKIGETRARKLAA